MNLNRVQTQEYAKNPNAETRVRCSKCGTVSRLEDMLKEEPCPPPYETVLEGVLICPQCGDRRHNYFMPELLRFDQSKLYAALKEWNLRRTTSAHQTYKKRFQIFQNNYIRSQKKYEEIFGIKREKEVEGASDG